MNGKNLASGSDDISAELSKKVDEEIEYKLFKMIKEKYRNDNFTEEYIRT